MHTTPAEPSYRNPELGTGQRMTRLAETFPTLRGKPGVDPWEPAKLRSLVMSGKLGHGAVCAAQFVLELWSRPNTPEGVGFNVYEALGIWDPAHRAAFAAWAQEPWWP